MGIGTSIFLIAVGAILRFAVTATVSGISIATVGTILLVVGIIGLLISLLYMTLWADRTRRDAAVVDRGPVAPADREVVRERY
jgi:beta-lactamase regulating signal transducer with metallopeptidase domain